ncbi:MAG TPA: LPS assembly lipoprotein LptE [Paenirhodobacter sp.]
MSSSDRRTFLRLAGAALGAATLAACGFTPAYAPSGGAKRLLSGVAFADPRSREDFALTQRLSERLGPPESPHYRLEYFIRTEVLGQAITPDNATTRYSLSGNVDYTLRDIGTNAVLLTGRAASFTSWSASGSAVATQAADEDARKRLMVILADQIVTRLLAQAGSLPQ